MTNAIFNGIRSLIEVLPERTKGPGMVISLASFLAITFLLKYSIPIFIDAGATAWAAILMLAQMAFSCFLVWANRTLSSPLPVDPDQQDSEPIVRD